LLYAVLPGTGEYPAQQRLVNGVNPLSLKAIVLYFS
jgi:hypothetical protein